MLKFVELTPKELDKYVFKNHPEANFLQTSAWGKVYEIDSKETFYRGVEKDGKLVASALIILKPAKRGRYLEIPGGPLLDWDKDRKTLKFFLDGIYKLAEEYNCVFVRMRPNIYDTPEREALAKELGLVKSPMHLHAEHTVMLDLTKTEDELLADMRRQTRYDIRRSAKLGIKVDFDNSEDAFDAFYDIQPMAPVHVLIVPKIHIASVNEVTSENSAVIGHIYEVAALLAKELGVAESGYRVVSNCGADAGQTVFHLHFHLLGGQPLKTEMC